MSTNKFRQNFAITCYIGSQDYTQNLQRVRIIGSVASLYHMVILEFLAEGENIISKQLFGKDDILIEINNVREDMVPIEPIRLNLVYIRSDGLQLKNTAVNKISVEPSDTYPEKITIGCILKQPLENMSTIINKCFQENFQKPPLDAIVEVAQKFLPNMKTDIGKKYKNTGRLPRTFNIRNMAFSDFVRFMDSNELGGIYNTPSVAFHGLNKFYMWSTKDKLEDSPAYRIHLLPMGGEADKIIEACSITNSEFYTRVPINTRFYGPGNVVTTGGKSKALVSPDDTLFHELSVDVESVLKQNAARTGDMEMRQLHSSIRNIEKYYPEYSGHGYEDNFFRRKLASHLSFQSEIIIQLTRNINAFRLLVVGSAMEFKPHSLDYMPYGGKYITMAVDISYNRSQSEVYHAAALLRCVRSNVENE